MRKTKKAAGAAQAENATAQRNFESLEAALEGWFDKPSAKLPEDKRLRIERDSQQMLLLWDKRTKDARRSAAKGWDYLHDPATQPERQRISDVQAELYEVDCDIRKWELKATSTAGDEAIKEDHLKRLRDKAKKLEDAIVCHVKKGRALVTTIVRTDDRAFWREDKHFLSMY